MCYMMQILWRPESGRCSQCSCECSNVRMFTSHGQKTLFCRDCWNDFMLECNIPSGPWKLEISKNWDQNIDLILVVEYGTTQAVGWI